MENLLEVEKKWEAQKENGSWRKKIKIAEKINWKHKIIIAITIMMIIKIIIIIINLTAGSLIISLLSIVFQVCLNSAITDTNAPIGKIRWKPSKWARVIGFSVKGCPGNLLV